MLSSSLPVLSSSSYVITHSRGHSNRHSDNVPSLSIITLLAFSVFPLFFLSNSKVQQLNPLTPSRPSLSLCFTDTLSLSLSQSPVSCVTVDERLRFQGPSPGESDPDSQRVRTPKQQRSHPTTFTQISHNPHTAILQVLHNYLTTTTTTNHSTTTTHDHHREKERIKVKSRK